MKTFDKIMFFLLALVVSALILTLNSCQLRVDADGSRTWSMDLEQARRAIEIYAEK